MGKPQNERDWIDDMQAEITHAYDIADVIHDGFLLEAKRELLPDEHWLELDIALVYASKARGLLFTLYTTLAALRESKPMRMP